MTITVPFNPAQMPAGQQPALFKTNAQNQWEQVANATFGTNSVTAQVTSFSFVEPVLVTPANTNIGRQFSFKEFRTIGLKATLLEERTIDGGVVSEFRDFGSAAFDAEFALFDGRTFLPDNRANGAVSTTGKTGARSRSARRHRRGAWRYPRNPSAANRT